MDQLLRNGERIDDLQCNGFKLIQNPNEFCFGIDAVLLSNFINIKKRSNILDLGCGSGIIPMLIAAKNDTAKIVGIEIQSLFCDLAERNVKLNNVGDRVSILNKDLKNATEFLEKSSFDLITCNPPYKKESTGVTNPNDSKAIARHEIKCTLEDIIEVSSKLLKGGGRLCLINRPERFLDMISLMRKYKIEPKRARFVHSRIDKHPSMVMTEGARNGGEDFRVMEPLIIYDENGHYTSQIKNIYYGEIKDAR